MLRLHRDRQNLRSQSANNQFRHCEHVRRPWHLRIPDESQNSGSSNNDNLDADIDIDIQDRTRGSNTSEYLQKMILRLELLVRQQRALARNSNRRLNDNRQSETNRENDNREMEEIREATRLRAR